MKILFICTGNAVRSQMAEGFGKALGPKDWEFKSAGVIPAGLQEHTVLSMQEVGIDISHQESKRVEAEALLWADYVITLSDRAKNSIILSPSQLTLNWSIPDPISATGTEEEILQEYSETRDLLKAKIIDFIETH